MKRLVVTIFMVNCVVILSEVQKSQGATLLGEASGSLRGYTNPEGHPVDGLFLVIELPYDVENWPRIGGHHLWTEPEQVIFTPQSEPQWDDFVANLTNGNDEYLMFLSYLVSGEVVRGGGGYGATESRSFGRDSDFFGCMIEYMTLDVTYLYYNDTGTHNVDLILSVYGIPEPGMVLLLSLGAVMLRRKR